MITKQDQSKREQFKKRWNNLFYYNNVIILIIIIIIIHWTNINIIYEY